MSRGKGLGARLSRMSLVCPHRRSPRARRALTVVEVLVALLVLSVGLLGLAGASALSLRTATSSAVERRAVHRLALRHAALSARGCVPAVVGVHEESGGGVREQWTVHAPARGVAMIEATARWLDGGRPRALVLRSAILC